MSVKKKFSEIQFLRIYFEKQNVKSKLFYLIARLMPFLKKNYSVVSKFLN